MTRVTIRHAAEAGLVAAADWYESERPDRAYRKCLLHRFPVVIFYEAIAETAEVLALAHGSRKPGYRLER